MIPQTLSQARKIIDALKAKIISPKEFTIMNMSGPRCLEIAEKAKLEGKSVLSALVEEYKREQDEIDAKGQAPSASACTPTATAAPRPLVKAPARVPSPAPVRPTAPTPPATTSATATGPLARELAAALLDEQDKRDAAAKVRTRAQLDTMKPAQITAFFKNGGTLVS
jgi:hypothetical protein